MPQLLLSAAYFEGIPQSNRVPFFVRPFPNCMYKEKFPQQLSLAIKIASVSLIIRRFAMRESSPFSFFAGFSAGFIKLVLLLWGIKYGEQKLAEKYLFEYQNLVYSVAVSIIKDIQLAEDIVQEVFLTLYFKSGSIRDRNKIKHWLARTTANRAIDFLRRSQKIVILSEDFFGKLPNSTWADPVVEMDKKELVLEIHKAIDKLPEDIKILVILYYFVEIPQKEIAEILGIPLGTVKSRLRRARLTLKGHLLREESDTATSEKGGVSQ